jgi:formylglycine-generating enzyme required for sulfatase activity
MDVICAAGSGDIFSESFEFGTFGEWDQVVQGYAYPIQITLPGGIPMQFALVPPGTFSMGSPVSEDGRNNNEDLHEVTLSQPYYLAKTEVTQEQWEAVMGSPMPTACGSHGVGPDFPVYCVSWNEIRGANGFIERLEDHLIATGQPGVGLFRLPTEAEWERAVRSDNQFRFGYGDALECDNSCTWCLPHDQNMWWCGNDDGGTEPVGTKLPNSFGLYDMHGNLWEWVEDWYEGHLGFDPETDPPGPTWGTERVARGGSWSNGAGSCRSASRVSSDPSYRYGTFGFRLARSQ